MTRILHGRLLATAVAALLLPVLLAGCGDPDTKKEEMLEIIAATKAKARKFNYVDQAAGGTDLAVVGVVVDDYRFKARLSLAGEDVLEEAAIDDALAMRFLKADRLGFFVDPQKLRAAQLRAANPPPQKNSQASVFDVPLDALVGGRWVVDPVGAPSLVVSETDIRTPGVDPVLDAMTALDYVARVVRGAQGVVLFNKDALSPTYKQKEDDFPQPEKSAKIKRYDIPLRDFPKVQGGPAGGGRNDAGVPVAENFRKMAIYVKDGIIVELREHIDVPNRLDDLVDAFDLPESTTAEQAIVAINKVRQAKGEKEVFRPRRMRLSLTTELAAEDEVRLPPAGQFAPGTLSIIKNRGKPTARSTTSTTTPPGTSAMTETTAAAA